MDVSVVVGCVAAVALVLSALISAQRVPSEIRQIEKLAQAAHAVGADEETKRQINRSIRLMLPDTVIFSIWSRFFNGLALGAYAMTAGLILAVVVDAGVELSQGWAAFGAALERQFPLYVLLAAMAILGTLLVLVGHYLRRPELTRAERIEREEDQRSSES